MGICGSCGNEYRGAHPPGRCRERQGIARDVPSRSDPAPRDRCASRPRRDRGAAALVGHLAGVAGWATSISWTCAVTRRGRC